jgi:hypothetical protein
MIHPSRSRHGPVRRGLALWLIAAQLMLFGATGLAHRHAVPTCGTKLACASGAGWHAAARARLTAPSAGPRHTPPSCAICQTASATVVSLATAACIAHLTSLDGQTPSLPISSLPALLAGPSSARAPPIV